MKNHSPSTPVLPWRRRAQQRRDDDLLRTVRAIQTDLQALRTAINPPGGAAWMQVRLVEESSTAGCLPSPRRWLHEIRRRPSR